MSTLVYGDRVKETATTTGTGTFDLLGAVAGFRTFASAIPNTSYVHYCISQQTPGEWEVGVGILDTALSKLARSLVLASSNAGALVAFSAGTKDVFCVLPAATGLLLLANQVPTVDVTVFNEVSMVVALLYEIGSGKLTDLFPGAVLEIT